MVPNINPRGHSFTGITQYVLHDKGAETSERVGNTSTHNLHTDNIQRASRFMAWTDKNREFIRSESGGSNCGAKATAGNVYHQSISWKPGDEPSWDHMQKTAIDLVKRQGLEEHQFYLVEHTDEPHRHLHIVVNLVHPNTGKIHNVYKDRKVADRWANEYEQKHGVQCENRAKKYDQWQQQIEEERPSLNAFGVKAKREEYTKAATFCFEHSDDGKSFIAAMESHGLTVARGNRRGYVFVDPSGEIYSLNRHIQLEGGETRRAIGKKISARLAEVDQGKLRVADELANERKYYDRDAQEVQQQNALLDGAEVAAQGIAEREEKVTKEAKPKACKRPKFRLSSEQKRDLVDREKAARLAAFKRVIKEKTEKSRAKWQIEECTKRRDQSFTELKKLSGWWSRTVLKRSAYLEAKDQYQNAESQLQERTVRFRDDVAAFNQKRPEYIVRRVLKEQGVNPDVKMPSRDIEQRNIAAKAAFDKRIAKDLETEQSQQSERQLEAATQAKEPEVKKTPEEHRSKAARDFLTQVRTRREANENRFERQQEERELDKDKGLDRGQAFLERMKRQREQTRERDRDQGLER